MADYEMVPTVVSAVYCYCRYTGHEEREIAQAALSNFKYTLMMAGGKCINDDVFQMQREYQESHSEDDVGETNVFCFAVAFTKDDDTEDLGNLLTEASGWEPNIVATRFPNKMFYPSDLTGTNGKLSRFTHVTATA